MKTVKRPAALTLEEANAVFDDPTWSAKFPPFLTKQHVAELLEVPISTVYAWSSQGLLDPCKVRAGKHLRFLRNRFVQLVSEGKLHGS